MSLTTAFSRRSRRTTAALAAALATTGLALAVPTASAAPTPAGTNAVTATVTPSTVAGGSTTGFDLKVSAGDFTGNAGSLIKVAVPSGFDNVNVTPGTFTYSSSHTWSQSFESPNTIVFTQTNASGGLVGNEWLDVHLSAHAVGGGAQTFATSAWKGTATSSNALPVLASPVVTISGGAQHLTFGALSNKTWGDPDFTVAATSDSSANPITYTAAGDCSVSGNTVHLAHLANTDACTITAHQAAGNGYTAASDAAQSFSIGKAAQTITFGSLPGRTYGDADFSVSATASSGLAVSFAASGQCTVTGSTVHLTGAGGCTITASQAGNADYAAATDVPQAFVIAKAGATVTLSDVQQTYDGTGHAVTATTDPSGLAVEVTYSQDGSPVASPTAAGTYDVTATVDDANYAGSATGQLVIAPMTVHGAFTVSGKTYDGTDAATITDESVSDAVAGDDVDLTGGSATFDSENAGSRTATLTGATLTGADAANYTLSTDPITTTATIDPRQVTAVLSVSDKEYDGTTDVVSGEATVALTDGDAISPDTVGVAIDAASFDGTDVGQHTVTATVHLTDNALGNYTLGTGTSVSDGAGIYQRLTTGSFTVSDRTYDATTTATVASTHLTRVVNSDDVSLVVSPVAFLTKDAAPGKEVDGTFALSGTRADQYLLVADHGTTTASIGALGVTGSITADNKVWDGTTAATVHPSVSGILGSDAVTIGGTGTFASPAVGTWTVTSTDLALSGADAGNYALAAGPWTTTAKITPKYAGTGFYQPVDMPSGGTVVYNPVKGGQTVPLKFNVKDSTGANQTSLTIFGADAAAQAAAFTVKQVTCTASTDIADAVLTTSGSTALRYDTTGNQYIQNWKTPTTTGSCYSVTVRTVDGSAVGPAYFKITK